MTLTTGIMDKNVSSLSNFGTKLDDIVLNIDYKIIEHFSSHLYSSPHKSIEELVSNGFDAGATRVNVFFGQSTNSCVIVWDNGNSMDLEELRKLWDIANSPKASSPDARKISVGENERSVIGKFGIGKLASYTVGNLIAHICKKDNSYLYIDVDYEKIFQEKFDSQNPGRASVRKLSQDEARELLKSKFSSLSDSFDEYFDEPNWTFALIEKLKTEKPLYEGRLKWMLGNSMPLRPDFSINVNTQAVKSKLSVNNPEFSWNFESKEFQEALEKSFEEAKRAEYINYDYSEISYGKSKGIDPANPSESIPYVNLKHLGPVWGDIKLFSNPLEKPKSRSSEIGRSHGFFIYVNGRLINEEDDKVLLHEPSFAAFYRSQFIIFSDELDSELLADRERIKLESDKSGDLKLLQNAMYKTARAKYDAIEKEAFASQIRGMVDRVPLYSRQFYIEPITALMQSRGHEISKDMFSDTPTISQKSLGENERIANITSDGNFLINSDHPFFRSLDSQFNGRQKQEVLNEFELIAMADTLTEGYLHEVGVVNDLIDNIFDWRDKFLRMLVHSKRPSVESSIKILEESSYFRGAPFENAVTAVLNEMGFKASRHGESGKKDIFVNAYAGTGSTYKLIFEAKAIENKDGVLNNVSAAVGGAARHRDESKADHAIIISRKFAGYDRATADDTQVAIYGECAAVGRVSFMTTEALGELLRVVRRHHYPLDIIKPILFNNQHPDDKLADIKKLDEPLKRFNFSDLIDLIDFHTTKYNGDHASVLYIYYDLREQDPELKQEDVKIAINALYMLASDLISFDIKEGIVALKQSPVNVKRAIADRMNP